MIKKVFYKLRKPVKNISYNHSKFRQDFSNYNLSIDEIKDATKDRNVLYKFFHQYYWHVAPVWLREHRNYFSQNNRGYGEDAFHSAWYLFIKKFRPQNLLEIGVYRGQVISLWSLIGQKENIEMNIHGISPFSHAGDNVSKYVASVNYYKDVINNFNYFSLTLPHLHKGYSTDEEMKQIIKSQQWDLIYIDGSHAYEIAIQDFKLCSKNLNKGGVIVMDDSALYTNYKPPLYSFAGHPGPSRVVKEIKESGFTEILGVGHNRYFRK